jgi:hypothetical protein
MVQAIGEIPRNEDSDVVFWALNKNGKFSTKSMYVFLEKSISGANYKWIWGAKLPLKIKIFMWQLFQNAIVTRDNMKKRKWPGSPVCSFCRDHESALHLMFQCPSARCVWGAVGSVLGTNTCPNNLWQALTWFYAFVPGGSEDFMVGISAICWAIWKTRNKVTFENHKMRTPCEIMFFASALLMYWAGLQKDQGKEMIQRGASKLMEKASDLLRSSQGGNRLMIPFTGMVGSGA